MAVILNRQTTAFFTASTPTTVESILVNGGEAQRSSVDTVQVTFNQIVDTDEDGGNPFSLIHQSGDAVDRRTPNHKVQRKDIREPYLRSE